jgi:2-hydroxychromene-2-carboxylate isomerase/glutathione S-transferase
VWSLWGADLSPFALKVELLLRFAGVPFRWLPASGSAWEAQRFNLRRVRLLAGRLPLTWPEKDPLDEFPLVPFLFGPGGENLYDSTSIGVWLDRTGPHPASGWTPLLPAEDRALRVALRLVDEALDEVGLYLVHHNRWVVSARDNDAGARLARQMRPLLGPAARLLARSFPARQVRRLPYLFSVAPEDLLRFADLPARLRPPAREEFPATHALLEEIFRRLLEAVEPLLSVRPFLFGERFTLADAGVYGQLAMNRTDPSAWAWIAREAPATGAWIERLAAGDFSGHRAAGPLVLDGALAPLLEPELRRMATRALCGGDTVQREGVRLGPFALRRQPARPAVPQRGQDLPGARLARPGPRLAGAGGGRPGTARGAGSPGEPSGQRPGGCLLSRLARRISPLFSAALTDPRTRRLRRAVAEQGRRIRRQPHRIRYFHQVDDPYSHLAAQVLSEMVARYDVELEPHLVGPPPDDAAPERRLLESYARKDAADVAPSYGLEFPRLEAAPGAEACLLASRLLAGAAASAGFPEQAPRIGRALWARDDAGLTRAAVEAGSELRRRLGHYLGAMFHYAGEWYWGVDRLWHLERRLQEVGALRSGQPADAIVPRPDYGAAPPVASDRRLRLEYFPSLRSPYSAIAMRRALALPERLPVDLVLRPVLPMVMRGLPVPRAKALYILLDTKREAEDAEVPFGRVCDPLGRPVERGFSLYPWAQREGRGGALLESFTRAAFAEGIDTGEDAGLRVVVERAGLPWEEARRHLDGDDWREELEQNRAALLEHGLWGVPSFRLVGEGGEPDFSTWGQDRIWRVEEEVRRRSGR